MQSSVVAYLGNALLGSVGSQFDGPADAAEIVGQEADPLTRGPRNLEEDVRRFSRPAAADKGVADLVKEQEGSALFRLRGRKAVDAETGNLVANNGGPGIRCAPIQTHA